jgi:TPR repeat protein
MRSLILALGLGLLATVAVAQPSPTPPAKTEPAKPGADAPSPPPTARGPMAKMTEADQTCRSMLPALMAEAEKGNALSAFRVGVIYDNGCGVRGDQQVAAAYYELAAKGGYADGAVHLAKIYIDGEALKQDYGKARVLLDKPSKAGHPVANYLLGVIAYRGDEVKPAKPDIATAMKYFRAAADGGFAQAQFIIGQAAAEGVELPKDGKLAKFMLLRAAGQGHGWAQAILGRMLADNELPDADPVEAMTWLSLAKRDYGSDPLLLSVVDANLKKVQPRLSPEQLKQAQDRIAAYQPRPEWEEKI